MGKPYMRPTTIWPMRPALKTLSENHAANERKKKEMRVRSEMTGDGQPGLIYIATGLIIGVRLRIPNRGRSVATVRARCHAEALRIGKAGRLWGMWST